MSFFAIQSINYLNSFRHLVAYSPSVPLESFWPVCHTGALTTKLTYLNLALEEIGLHVDLFWGILKQMGMLLRIEHQRQPDMSRGGAN